MIAVVVLLALLAGTSYVSWILSRDFHTYTGNRFCEVRVCVEAERCEDL